MKLLVESITILYRFSNQIVNRAILINDFGLANISNENITEKELTLLITLFNMIIIDSVSYLDEYDQVFGINTETLYKNRIVEVKSINKPFISKIKEWKDLRNMRNQLLAHNLRRGKNGDFIFSIDNYVSIAPITLNDLFLLVNLIKYSTKTITLEFQEEISKIATFLERKYQRKEKSLSNEEVILITNHLVILAQKEATRLKKDYHL
jgi:hypothetical protein